MKIYPEAHKISAKEDTTPLDIPLAYIESITKNAELSLEPTDDFSRLASTSIVDMYQKFTNPDTLFFDEDGKPTDVELKRVGSEYMYNPAVTEWTPDKFSYRTILQRSGDYRADLLYNVRIGIVDDDGAKGSFFQSLVSLFSDSSMKPTNLSINNGEMTEDSFINVTYDDADFIFVSLESGVEDVSDIPISDILASNCNIWLFVKSFGSTLVSLEDSAYTCYPSKHQVYTTDSYDLDYAYRFDVDTENKSYPMSSYEYINLFDDTCPILVLKSEYNGYIIVSEVDFLDHLDTQGKLIFEIMMQVFMSGYLHTSTRTTWITDELIDYYLNRYTLFQKRHPVINIFKQLEDDGINTKIDLNIVNVLTDENVTYKKMDIKGNMYFEKVKATDPVKGADAISLYSTSGSVLYYDNLPVIQTIADALTIDYTYEEDTGTYQITIPAFRDSDLYLWTDQQTIAITPTDETEYILYVDRDDSKQSASVWYIVPASGFVDINGIKAATITVKKEYTLNVYDLRQDGGGEASPVPNYEMIDTGSLLGRPYRLGSTLIIRFPKSYEQYKDILQEQIERNISSGEYPILIFEG